MTLTDWREQRSNELHRFRGKVGMIATLLERGTYTAAQAVREMRDADDVVLRRFTEIDAAWEKDREGVA